MGRGRSGPSDCIYSYQKRGLKPHFINTDQCRKKRFLIKWTTLLFFPSDATHEQDSGVKSDIQAHTLCCCLATLFIPLGLCSCLGVSAFASFFSFAAIFDFLLGPAQEQGRGPTNRHAAPLEQSGAEKVCTNKQVYLFT